MPTTGIINGTLMRLYKDAVAIGYATSCQMNISSAMREILTKDSAAGGWREVKKGQLSGTLSTEALYAGPGDASTNYLFDDLSYQFNSTKNVFELTQSGVALTDSSNNNSIVLINNILQIPIHSFLHAKHQYLINWNDVNIFNTYILSQILGSQYIPCRCHTIHSLTPRFLLKH
jgi:hypothetical protein